MTGAARCGLGLGLAVALALTVPAVAAKPKVGNPAAFRGHRIVDGVSIGGVKVGMTKAQAIAVWGKPDGVCRRGNPYDPDDLRRMCNYGYASFVVLPSGKVTGVWIGLTKPPGRTASFARWYRLAAPKVLPFKSAKNIGLRSRLDDARRAYGVPAPGKLTDWAAQNVVVRQPQGCTWFSWRASKPTFAYVDGIQVTSPAWCPKDPDEKDSQLDPRLLDPASLP